MKRLYSYVLRFDDGAAPNPFWNKCTLTICKPVIRRTSKIGDWVIGTGSKNSELNDKKVHDLSNYLVYAMQITDIKSLQEYDEYCRQSLTEKIPGWYHNDWRKRLGDCIYDYRNGLEPIMRKGVHNESNRERDLSGQNALLSTHFYYFGENALKIPDYMKEIIKRNQGHLKIEKTELIHKFENWIMGFEKNKIYGNPQLKHEFDRYSSEEQIARCSKRDRLEDEDESEVKIC